MAEDGERAASEVSEWEYEEQLALLWERSLGEKSRRTTVSLCHSFSSYIFPCLSFVTST